MTINSRQKGAADEEWRPAPGWEGLYEVSSHGRVRGIRRQGCHGRPIFQGLCDRGYPQVYLFRHRRQHTTKVHRLVALAFLGPKPDGLQVNHIDGKKTNNLASNLEYVTNQENAQHARRLGLQPAPKRGRDNHMSGALRFRKLTPEQVQSIRSRLKRGEMQKTIAKEFGLHQVTVSEINTRKIWAWL